MALYLIIEPDVAAVEYDELEGDIVGALKMTIYLINSKYFTFIKSSEIGLLFVIDGVFCVGDGKLVLKKSTADFTLPLLFEVLIES